MTCPKCGGSHQKMETIHDRDEKKLHERLSDIKAEHPNCVIKVFGNDYGIWCAAIIYGDGEFGE